MACDGGCFIGSEKVMTNTDMPYRVEFASDLVRTIVRWVPAVRGAPLLVSFLMRIFPFLKRTAVLSVNETQCHLDMCYRTHLAFLLRPFETIESNVVMHILRQGDVFFDIGSNWGYYAFLGSAAVGQRGRVVAVEANPVTFARLLKMIRISGLDNVTPFNLAVSNITGESISISLPWYRVDTGGFMVENRTKGTIRTRTLDLLWFQMGTPLVRMVKIDTEGAEPLILDGGAQFFTNGVECAALVEVGDWSRERFGYEPVHVYERMREYGFKRAYAALDNCIKEITQPWSSSKLFLGNVLFCKDQCPALLNKRSGRI